MANRQHENHLASDVTSWNQWRLHNPDINPALSEADLRGADLSEAYLYRADLRGADLFVADLSGADLFGADLFGANLRRADLRGANLREADLRRADLRGADLREADLRGADLTEADLTGGFDRSSVKWNAETIWPADTKGDDPDGDGELTSQRADISDDPTRKQLLSGAVEDYMSEFRALLHDSTDPLDQYTAAKVQYAVDSLGLENRNPDGPDPLQVERAQAIGLQALVDYGVVDNPVIDHATQLGDDDPNIDGDRLDELLTTAAAGDTPPPPNQPQPESTSASDPADTATAETLAERTKDSLWDGYDDLIKSLPKTAALTAAGAITMAASESGLIQAIIKMALAIWQVVG